MTDRDDFVDDETQPTDADESAQDAGRESRSSDEPFDIEEVSASSNSVVSAIHELPHDPDGDPFTQSNRASRTIYLFVGLVVAALGLIIGYKILTDGVGTQILADYDAGPSRADFQAEPTPPPQPPATVIAQVASDPPGAAIIVNGVPTRQTTPASVELVEDGINVVSLHLDGYVPYFATLRGGEELDQLLEPLPPPPPVPAAEEAEAVADGTGAPADPGPGIGRGRIRVLVKNTAGEELPAEVLFNGQPVGNAPVLLDVDSGIRHHVAARMAGMRVSTGYARAIPWVDRNSETVVTLELTADSGDSNRWTSIRIRTAPADATVLVDGERRPSTGLINVDSPAHHIVEVSAPDHVSLVRGVDGRLGQVVIDAVLEPIRTGPAALTLTVDPPEALVFIERLRHGSPGARQIQTPTSALEVESGPYQITIEQRTESDRVRGRFEVELEPGMHHQLSFGVADGQFVETGNTVRER